MNLFINDEYFRKYPQNILAIAYKTSGRFGEVTKYKGTIEDVSRIVATDYTPQPFSFSVSRSVEKNDDNKLSENEIKNIKKALSKSEKERTTIREYTPSVSKDDLITFDEVDTQYNAHISEHEKIAFVWYMKYVLNRPMEGGWSKYHRKMTKTELSEYVKKGILMYDNGVLVPSFIYYSGNIYNKFSQLERDRDNIISEYGNDAYEGQFEHLSKIKNEVYRRRMVLDAPNPDDRLIILPTSEFAKKFKIKTLKDGLEVRANVLSKGIAWNNNVEKNFTTIQEPTLQEAFIFWLRSNARKIAFRFGLDWLSVYDLGIYDKKYVKIGVKEDDTKEKDEFKKKKAKAKMEAKRLFSDFLANELDLNDKVKIETQWNQQYNANYPLDLNRVPIGFTMSRRYAGLEMDIRSEKREAIAFAMMEGSGCISYGVGLGKTWCAIFIFAQFIENGWALRPLLAVPNQVYKQFMNEIRGILPHVQVNDFYNLSDKYLENVPRESAYFVDQKNFKGIFLNGEDATKLDSEKENLLSFYSFIESYSEQVRMLQVFPMPDSDQFFRVHNGYHLVFDSKDVQESKKFGAVKPKSISLVTYEGLRRIGIDESAESDFFVRLHDIMRQNNQDTHGDSKKKQQKAQERFSQKIKSKIGKGQLGTEITIQALGIDMITVDEAHSMKKVFTEVKGEGAEEGKQNKKAYKITSGTPSTLATKGFMLSQYIQYKNPTGNVIILTATPFTNSPLEVYSMVSLVGFKYLNSVLRLANLQDFFDNYVSVSYELVIDAKLKPVMKEIFVGFNNLPSLQGLIKKFFLYKQSTDTLKRPDKIVLPLRQRVVNGVLIDLEDNERIDTILEMSPLQKEYMDEIIAYAEGKSDKQSEITSDEDVEDLDGPQNEAEDEEDSISESSLSQKEKTAIRLLRAMAWSRAVALSPFLYKKSGVINYKTYIETSAKLFYAMKCIRSVKEYHEKKGEPVSGQVIYMNRGIEYFDLIKEYLIREVGFKDHEIGIIRSKMPKGKDKAWVQDRFLGRQWNETTREHEPIPDSERIKIIIGSATIKEGLNLQKYGTVLYDLYMDWNPTDKVQLEGRIWRQGNLFKYVRIVTPLLEDSMDIFMFQKQEEKTRRINAIWDYDGNAKTLNLEEFNHAELKYALIKDPRRVAELESSESKEKIEDEISVHQTNIRILQEYKELYQKIQDYIKEKYTWIEFWRDVDPIESYLESPQKFQNTVIKIMNEGVLKDGSKVSEIKDPYMNNYQVGLYVPVIETGPSWNRTKVVNGIPKVVEPYSYRFSWKDFKDAVRRYNRTYHDIIKPKGIDISVDDGFDEINDENGNYQKNGVKFRKVAKNPNSLTAYIIQVESKILEAKKRIEQLGSDESLTKRAAEITEQRLRSNLSSATIDDRVRQFERLNYLLSQRKYEEAKIVKMAAPSVSNENQLYSDTLELIETLTDTLPYLEGSELKETKELIEVLSDSLNYLKAA